MASEWSISGVKASITGKANREAGELTYCINRSNVRFSQTAGMLLGMKVCCERVAGIELLVSGLLKILALSHKVFYNNELWAFLGEIDYIVCEVCSCQ